MPDSRCQVEKSVRERVAVQVPGSVDWWTRLNDVTPSFHPLPVHLKHATLRRPKPSSHPNRATLAHTAKHGTQRLPACLVPTSDPGLHRSADPEPDFFFRGPSLSVLGPGFVFSSSHSVWPSEMTAADGRGTISGPLRLARASLPKINEIIIWADEHTFRALEGWPLTPGSSTRSSSRPRGG